ncbi:NirD/YgiW/YdeI family stress tolerance protein [Endozoicomonas sp.]|uniref:NirD/YgiW/YdeI family stress tolerance protein n=1 Tax=Endozoicomonas sp. TaxID=1892382 RepID=UPI00288770A1|nr:NirD/YgiW/YdeI family stress tolerance protein [Endozoicomonas sp.]
MNSYVGVYSVVCNKAASVLIMVSLPLIVLCPLAHADYIGPGANVVGSSTVSAILKKPVDDMRVVLRGNLVKKIKHETYLFSDGTGEIQADIDDKDFPAQPVNAKTKVELVGEVDLGRKYGVEIDVKTLRILSP